MNKHRYRELYAVAAVAILTAAAGFAANSGGGPTRIEPATMPRIGTVSDRFLSYNIEMLEVTGGKFWKPYSALKQSGAKPKLRKTSTPAVMSALYQYRPPINLANPRLRKLAAALGPAYVRVSGTWANTTYFDDTNGPAPSHPPAGFNGVLTRNEWKGVVDFSHAANAQIITSFATSEGTRNATGVWTPGQANKFLAYTGSIGGNIAAAEFMNEPTFAAMGGAPKGYSAASFGRDLKVFIPFMRKVAPHTIILGPGSVGEGGGLAPPPSVPFLKTEALLQAAGPVFDAFSYHFYGAVSERCAAMGVGGTTRCTADIAGITDAFLGCC